MVDVPADLPALLTRAAGRWPDAVAWVFDESGEQLTFEAVLDRTRRLAAVLAAEGVGPGDRVAVMLDNRPEFPLTWLAAAWLGAAMVPVNTNYLDLDAGHVLAKSGASVLVTSESFLPLVERVRPSTSLASVLCVDAETAGTTFVPAALAAATGQEPVGLRSDRPVNIQFTSGTTGKPKGCVLPQRYWTTVAASLVNEHPHLDHEDVILTAQPFHYIDPQWNVAAGLAAGARLVVLDRFHPSTFWAKIREYGVTWFYCLGLMPGLLLKMPADSRDRDHRVRAVHCSAIPPALHHALEQRWGAPWFEAFGMTETGADLRLGPDDHDATVGSGCLGRSLAHREVLVADADGLPVAAGEVGELRLRGLGLMLGYHEDKQATRDCFDAGWFKTGDLARLDDQGRVYYVGRLKDSIRRSGENISAAEVEEAIGGHPAVRTVAVVPTPDDLRGEEVRAFVVPETEEAGASLARTLRDYCAERLAYFKVPRYWTFRDSLPMTASERVAKGTLRKEALGPDTHDLAPARRAGGREAGSAAG